MYNYDEIIPFLATLGMPQLWTERAIKAAHMESDIHLWSAIARGLALTHKGDVLGILKPFEI